MGKADKIVACIAAVLLLCGCKDGKEAGETPVQSNIPVARKTPAFNPDSAYHFIAAQTAFGPRVPNSKAHTKCGDYLVAKLEKYMDGVVEQSFEIESFDKKKLRLRNIVGSLNESATKRILIAAHWDSRPFADNDSKDRNSAIDGANDGASGVGVIIELARILSNDTSVKVGVDFLLLDGEDYGQPENSGFPEKKDSWCLGSQYWATHPHRPNYTAYYGILMDMVGGANARFAMDGTSAQFAPEVQKKIWEVAAASGYAERFPQRKVEEIIDDHYYINKDAKIPMVDIIEWEPSDGTFFSPTWHTHQDDLAHIDKATLKAVGQTVLNAVYNE